VLRDANRRAALEAALGGRPPVLCRFTQLELLAGCSDERQWDVLHGYLEAQDYVELEPQSWVEATRLVFELERAGKKTANPITCCIAELAIEHDLLLLHRDPDFEAIAEISNLRQRRLGL
jgi:predicted nucleic acid-binding protein